MEQNRVKTIGIRGSSGLVGKAVSLALQNKGWIVRSIGREFGKADISQCDVVINLAGHSINCRWTKSNRKLIYDSRINTTQMLASFINDCGQDAPALFISASASGIYPSHPVNGEYPVFTEDSNEFGTGFLASVCKDWESAAMEANGICRVAIIRPGVVLAARGGAYPKLATPFKLGIAATISQGSQPFPWIALEDLTDAVIWIIENESAAGVYNLASPEKENNRSVTEILSKRYRSFIKIRLPRFIFRLMLGESHILVTEGQYIYPQKLIKGGFRFKYSSFEQVVKRL